MKFVNLTPHTITICNEKAEVVATIPASGSIARVAANKKAGGVLVTGDTSNPNPVSLFFMEYGEVTGLPQPEKDTFYIVSAMVAARAPRHDVLSPGELFRNEAGQPIGCNGLTCSLAI